MRLHFAVIGASGFVGSHIIDFLNRSSFSYSILTFSFNQFFVVQGSSRFLLSVSYSSRFTHIIDCSNPHLPNLNSPSYISFARSFCYALKPYLINVHYCLLSSISVFGDCQTTISTSTIPTPSNSYGISKLYKESFFTNLFYSHYIRSCNIIRPTGILGYRMGNTFVKRLVFAASNNQPMFIYSLDALFNSIIGIYDLLDLIFMHYNCSSLNIVNAASSFPLTLNSVCKLIIQYFSSSSTILPISSGRQPFLVLNPSSSVSALSRSTKDCLLLSLPQILR